MKKRILSILLMLLMLLTLLPTAALAADTLPPAETAYWDNLTLQEAQSVVSSITGGSADTDIIFVYYKLSGCWNSATYVPEFAKYANDNHLEVCAYAYDPNAVSGDGTGLFAIFGLLGSSSLTFPVVVTYNAGTGQYQAADRVLGVDAFLTQLSASGLYDGSDSSDSGSSESGSSLTLYYDSSIDSASWEVLRLTNQHRMSMGLSPLSTTDAMQMAANQRAEELTVQYNSDHSRPDGSSCFTVFTDYSVSYNMAAENIAYGYLTAAAVVDGWLNSSGHRANIENGSLVHMGVGHASNYWSQDFVGSSSCSYSGISLSCSGAVGEVGQALEDILTDADITVTARCSQHGISYLPLIAAMCSGYDADTAGEQIVTVSLDGESTALTVTLTAAPGSVGDVNGDGNVTTADAVIVLRAVVGAVELTTMQMSAADFNGDGVIKTNDAILILRKALD